jgi:predicted O-linked N-acetylglucosamine transferase (SPINDLY family)
MIIGMSATVELLMSAIEHHRANRLEEAEALYKLVLAADPHHADAWHLSGMLAHQSGRHDLAVERVEHAIRIDGNQAVFHNTLGEACRALERLDAAGICFRRALELQPELAEAHNNLGLVWRARNHLFAAVNCFERALQLKPEFAEAYTNLGSVHLDRGRLDDALACYRRALQFKPDYPPALHNLKIVMERQSPEAHYNRGVVAAAEGRWDEARECYERALQEKPDFVEALGNLGIVWKEQGRLDLAVGYYQQALRINPNYVEALVNLGTAWKNLGRLDDAADCCQKALHSNPNLAGAQYGMGNVRNDQGRLDEALASYQNALQLDPQHVLAKVALVHQMQHVCQWTVLEELVRSVIGAVENVAASPPSTRVSPFAFLSLPQATTAQQQLTCAKAYAQRLYPFGSRRTLELNGLPARLQRNSTIRIGYLSADFRAHAVADLIVELLEQHDRRRFTVRGYSIGPDDGGPLRRRIVAACDEFIDLTCASHTDAAQRIAADQVDILIDLMGYTKHSRPQILAQRPAPIQVQYLGYPGTMGAPFVDYTLVDEFVVPRNQQPYFTEQLVYLPGCYQVNPSRRESPERIPSRRECGLPDAAFVYCCFNNSYKIAPETFNVWMGLLCETPGSVLWLFEGNSFMADNLRREAEVRGVASERLVFAPRLPLPEYIARHRVADLFLDTFPYNAHATASYALRAGCPVLTMAGQTFASRVSGSLLSALGLPELITTSHEEYRDRALFLARNPDHLGQLRARLEVNGLKSDLYNPSRFAGNVETAYATMWEIHAAGQPPRPITVSQSPHFSRYAR